MTPSPTIHDLNQYSAGRLAARIDDMGATIDPGPVSRTRTVSPGILLVVIVVGCIATATLGQWLHTQMVAFNDVIVKFFLVLIPLLFLAGIYFVVRLVGFWRASRVAEAEALAAAELEFMQREARFAAGRIKGDRRLCIRPKNRAALKAKRRRADRLRTA